MASACCSLLLGLFIHTHSCPSLLPCGQHWQCTLSLGVRAGEAPKGAQGGGRCPLPPLLKQGAGLIEELRLGSPRGLQWLHSTRGCSAPFPLVPKSQPPYRDPCAAGGCIDSPQHPQGLWLASAHRAITPCLPTSSTGI